MLNFSSSASPSAPVSVPFGRSVPSAVLDGLGFAHLSDQPAEYAGAEGSPENGILSLASAGWRDSFLRFLRVIRVLLAEVSLERESTTMPVISKSYDFLVFHLQLVKEELLRALNSRIHNVNIFDHKPKGGLRLGPLIGSNSVHGEAVLASTSNYNHVLSSSSNALEPMEMLADAATKVSTATTSGVDQATPPNSAVSSDCGDCEPDISFGPEYVQGDSSLSSSKQTQQRGVKSEASLSSVLAVAESTRSAHAGAPAGLRKRGGSHISKPIPMKRAREAESGLDQSGDASTNEYKHSRSDDGLSDVTPDHFESMVIIRNTATESRVPAPGTDEIEYALDFCECATNLVNEAGSTCAVCFAATSIRDSVLFRSLQSFQRVIAPLLSSRPECAAKRAVIERLMVHKPCAVKFNNMLKDIDARMFDDPKRNFHKRGWVWLSKDQVIDKCKESATRFYDELRRYESGSGSDHDAAQNKNATYLETKVGDEQLQVAVTELVHSLLRGLKHDESADPAQPVSEGIPHWGMNSSEAGTTAPASVSAADVDCQATLQWSGSLSSNSYSVKPEISRDADTPCSASLERPDLQLVLNELKVLTSPVGACPQPPRMNSDRSSGVVFLCSLNHSTWSTRLNLLHHVGVRSYNEREYVTPRVHWEHFLQFLLGPGDIVLYRATVIHSCPGNPSGSTLDKGGNPTIRRMLFASFNAPGGKQVKREDEAIEDNCPVLSGDGEQRARCVSIVKEQPIWQFTTVRLGTAQIKEAIERLAPRFGHNGDLLRIIQNVLENRKHAKNQILAQQADERRDAQGRRIFRKNKASFAAQKTLADNELKKWTIIEKWFRDTTFNF
jgi:hypothetical protein